MMSAVADSPVNSSSSDDFVAIIDAELNSTSDFSPNREDEDEDAGDSYFERFKRRKVEVWESTKDPEDSTPHVDAVKETSVKKAVCAHPGFLQGMCLLCGQTMDDDSAVRLGYIHKDLKLGNNEIARLRKSDLKNLLRHKKLCLVLDLDHTLLNSTLHLTPDEEYLRSHTDSARDISRGSLFRLYSMHMMTKLRPFVHTFLKEASKMFEMYIYTMGKREYALEMAKLLDPGNIYFSSRVIAEEDCTQEHQKGLDVVVGPENAVLILDDTEQVWKKHKENLILIERYHFFASSCRQSGFKSLSELKRDESETDGALASILKALKQIHSTFFDPELGVDLSERDARQVLKTVRNKVLKGCKVLFSNISTTFQADKYKYWKMAEEMGAICAMEADASVTHVVSADLGNEKSHWAVKENKFLVHPQWIEAAKYLWQRQPEEKFPINQMKN